MQLYDNVDSFGNLGVLAGHIFLAANILAANNAVV